MLLCWAGMETPRRDTAASVAASDAAVLQRQQDSQRWRRDMRGTCIRNMELQFAPFDLLDPHLVIHLLDLLTGADVAHFAGTSAGNRALVLSDDGLRIKIISAMARSGRLPGKESEYWRRKLATRVKWSSAIFECWTHG
eukprot:SAG25_NODE_334_length_9571_cov_73.030511_8_plen_139_part_00